MGISKLVHLTLILTLDEESNQSSDLLFFFHFKFLVSSTVAANFTGGWESLNAGFARGVLREGLCHCFRILRPVDLKIQKEGDSFYLILNYREISAKAKRPLK